MLSTEDLSNIIKALYSTYNVSKDVEITLEANPDDLTKDQIYDIKNHTPINRLSIGIQSFFDDDLVYLNRVHNSVQAQKSIETALIAGFDNMTIDLIYGIPTLTDKKWKENLVRFFEYDISPLSS